MTRFHGSPDACTNICNGVIKPIVANIWKSNHGEMC